MNMDYSDDLLNLEDDWWKMLVRLPALCDVAVWITALVFLCPDS